MNQQMWLFLHLHRNKNHVNDQQSWNQINLTSSYSHSQIPTCLTKHSQVVEEAGFTWLYSPSPPRSLSQRLPLATGNSGDLTSSDRNSHFETHRIWSSPRLAIAGMATMVTVSIESNWFKGHRMFYASAPSATAGAVLCVRGLEGRVSDLVY